MTVYTKYTLTKRIKNIYRAMFVLNIINMKKRKPFIAGFVWMPLKNDTPQPSRWYGRLLCMKKICFHMYSMCVSQLKCRHFPSVWHFVLCCDLLSPPSSGIATNQTTVRTAELVGERVHKTKPKKDSWLKLWILWKPLYWN